MGTVSWIEDRAGCDGDLERIAGERRGQILFGLVKSLLAREEGRFDGVCNWLLDKRGQGLPVFGKQVTEERSGQFMTVFGNKFQE